MTLSVIVIMANQESSVPEGAEECDALDTLLVACRPWQVDPARASFMKLAGDKIIELKVKQVGNDELRWIHIVYRYKVLVATFDTIIDMARWAQNRYVLSTRDPVTVERKSGERQQVALVLYDAA